MTSKKTFFKGVIDVLPLMIPVVPFGIIFGNLAIKKTSGDYIAFLDTDDI